MPKSERSSLRRPGVPLGLSHALFGAFLIITAVIAALAAMTVLDPHGVLVSIWSSKEAEYHQLLKVRLLAGVGFAALSVVLAVTAVGWFQHRRWAWILFSVILAVNFVSDVVRAIVTGQWLDLAGAAIEGLVLLWLTSRPIRTQYLRANEARNH